MYFRHKKTKTTPVLQLVKSFRNAEGQPRQRILLSLGDLDLPRSLWHPVAQELENRLKGISSLFFDAEVHAWVDKLFDELTRKNKPNKSSKVGPDLPRQLHVLTDTLTHTHATELGPELVVINAWQDLQFESHLTALGFSPTQCRDAAISIFNRLLDPCSDHALPDWVKTTSLADLFQQPLDRLGDDRFYRISDSLLGIKQELEQRLAETERNLFQLQGSIYLYDLSNTYFEGLAAGNPQAKHSGKSKEKRNDCPQLAFGMVLNPQGFVIKHEVFAGNQSDGPTLLEMVKSLAEGQEKPLVIIDSGMASQDNLTKLKDAGCDYITVKKRPSRMAYQAHFQSLDAFEKIKNREPKPDVLIKVLDEEDERLVCCWSQARAAKEKSILSKAETRFLKDLEKLKARIEAGRLKDPTKIQRQMGRLRERHSRIAKYYEMTFDQTHQNFTWKRDQDRYEQADMVTGGYVLRTNRKQINGEDIWNLYITLTRVEAGFRALKSHLGLRPIYHQTKDRCRGHIFITVLAYHLLVWIEHRLREQGDHRSWPTIRRLLRTHCYATLQFQSVEGKTYHLRQPGRPDTEQKKIYSLLNINASGLPKTTTIA